MPKNYRLLKGIVISLGILIVAMVIILVVASVMKYNDQKRAETALVKKYQSGQAVNPSKLNPFELNLSLESGQEIISVDSGDNGILASIAVDDVIVKVLLIDYSGKIVGTINVN